MSQSAKPQDDFRAEASILEGGAPLESILCTEELHLRPSRVPDYEKENHALLKLDAAGNFANNVARIFSTVGTAPQIQLTARFTF